MSSMKDTLKMIRMEHFISCATYIVLQTLLHGFGRAVCVGEILCLKPAPCIIEYAASTSTVNSVLQINAVMIKRNDLYAKFF